MRGTIDHITSSNADQELQTLSTRLKKMQKMLPKLNQTQQSFSISNFMRSENESLNQEKSIWTNTATGWTRDVQPVHAIPKARRFQQSKPCEVDLYPELDTDLRSKIDHRGTVFSKQKRQQLFKTLQNNPGPNKYSCRRYLEGYSTRPYSKQLQQINPEICSPREHIKGGTIGKFTNYPYLHYQQGIKRLYNEKLIEEARKQRNKNRSFKIRVNEKRNRSIN